MKLSFLRVKYLVYCGVQIYNYILRVKMGKKRVSLKKYAKISLQKRRKLIQMVTQLNKSIVQTAKQLKVKLSTAKLILKKFKQTGTCFDKKMPDYCRRKKKPPALQEKKETEVKLEPQIGLISISKIAASEQANQQKQKLETGDDCKEQEILPTMLYTYYYP